MDHNKFEEIHLFLQDQCKQDKFNGSLLAADRQGIILSQGYGSANIEHDVPNTKETKFLIASLTKSFTAIALMKLIERGMLNLNSKIIDFIESYPNGHQISIHHLLSHTSGIYNFTETPDFMEWFCKSLSIKQVMEKFIDIPLQYQPGEQFQYSNSNYILLTNIIEIVSNSSYGDFLKENIFIPSGMINTGIDNPRTINKRRATGYIIENNILQHSPFINVGNGYGAGCLYSTVEDLYKFDRALYDYRLLDQSSMEVMFTPIKNGFAYGWITQEENGRKVNGFSGGIHGFSSILLRYPDQQLCVIAISNMTQEVDSIAREIARMVLI